MKGVRSRILNQFLVVPTGPDHKTPGFRYKGYRINRILKDKLQCYQHYERIPLMTDQKDDKPSTQANEISTKDKPAHIRCFRPFPIGQWWERNARWPMGTSNGSTSNQLHHKINGIEQKSNLIKIRRYFGRAESQWGISAP